MKNNNLIYDLGFHIGQDTDYYLKKGFKVIAVEANPKLYREGLSKFKNFVEKGQLILINKAISKKSEKLKFYIHPTQSDWSSCFKEFINNTNTQLEEIEVDGITLFDLIKQYGLPRYIKVDIEGADVIVAEQISKLNDKPEYISFETSRRDYAKIFSYLYLAEYNNFQLINQLKYNNLILKDIKNEGIPINYTFEFGSSGLFGKDLQNDMWITYDELLSRYTKFIDLRNLDQENLSMGWLDIHAKLN